MTSSNMNSPRGRYMRHNQAIMSEVLSPPEIRNAQLLAVASIGTDGGGSSGFSSELETALAALRSAEDKQEIERLGRYARYLLSVKLPRFHRDWVYSLADLKELLAAIDSLQAGLQASIKPSLTGSPAVLEIAREVKSAATKLFDYSEEMRWAVMGAQAEMEIEAGKSRSFGSLDAAINFLKRKV